MIITQEESLRFKPLVLVVCGPTASGKSELAVELAKKYNGEIISADSRQVYRGLNIGAGKVSGKWQVRGAKRVFVYKNISHHCIDFVSLKRRYSVADFKHDGEKAMNDILSRGKTIIICGGTGQFVDALVFNQNIPDVVPDLLFRKKMETRSAAILFGMLEKQDPVRAKFIDPYNSNKFPRSLLRGLLPKYHGYMSEH